MPGILWDAAVLMGDKLGVLHISIYVIIIGGFLATNLGMGVK